MHARFWLVSVLTIIAAHAFADTTPANDFEKYSVITRVNPFRKSAQAAPVQAQPTIQGLRLVGTTSGSGPPKAWILDTKIGKPYYVAEGDRAGEYTVGKIDIANQTVELIAGAQREALKFPDKANPLASQPMSAGMNTTHASYRGPMRPPTPVPGQPQAAPPAANVAPAVAPAPAPTSLRRRILRQTAQANPAVPPPAPEAAPEAEENKPADGEQPAEPPAAH